MWVWLGNNFHALTIVISATGLVLSIIGGFFALMQWRHSTALKRAEIIKQIVGKMRFDKDIADISYMLEYDKFEYTEEFHNDNQLQQRIDSLLALLDYACYLRSNKILEKKEFAILEYKVAWIIRRRDIQPYLWNLHHFAKFNKTKCSFHNLVDFGIKNKLFFIDFENDTCEQFKNKKFLNF